MGKVRKSSIAKIVYFAVFFLLVCVAPLAIMVSVSSAGYRSSDMALAAGNALSIIVSSLFFLLSVVEGLSLLFDKTASVKTFLLTLCLLFMALTSNGQYAALVDFNPQIGEHEFVKTLFQIFNFLSFSIASYLFFSYLMELYSIPRSSFEKWTIYILLGVSLLMNFFFSIFNVPFAGPFLVAITLVSFGCRAIWLALKNNMANFNFLCLFTIGICILSAFLNESSIFLFSFYQGALITQIVLAFAFVAYLAIYLNFVINKTKSSYKEEANAAKIKELQANVLKNQISPHYIFNALNVVKSLYNEDKEQGDLALELLSRHLRAYTKAADKIMVPLSEELDVVADFVELEGLKYGKPIEVIYDIDSDSIEVPYFSLEPLVENALRYSKIMDKEDGQIIIRAHEEEERFILAVEDNGVGFDPNDIRPTSYGINNVKDRMEILLNASFLIESELGKGTKITIEIPKNRGMGK